MLRNPHPSSYATLKVQQLLQLKRPLSKQLALLLEQDPPSSHAYPLQCCPLDTAFYSSNGLPSPSTFYRTRLLALFHLPSHHQLASDALGPIEKADFLARMTPERGT